MSRQISRRDILIGGAALGLGGAFAAAGLATGVRPAAAAAPVFPVARVGATFDLFPFAPGTTFGQAIDFWNNITGTPMGCMKVYYGPSEFPTTFDTPDHRLPTLVARGIQALISFKPAFSGAAQMQADLASLTRALQLFQSNGLIAEVCLWQEVGPKDMTATQYHEVVAFYGPAVRQFYPLIFDVSGSQGPTEWAAYDPGQAQLDGYAADFYCGTFTNQPTIRLEALADLAGSLPVGIWEIGNTASNDFFPTKPQLDAYMKYMTGFLTGRAAAGLPVGSVAWYNGPADANQGGQNEIAGTAPNPLAWADVDDYQTLYDAVNGLA